MLVFLSLEVDIGRAVEDETLIWLFDPVIEYELYVVDGVLFEKLDELSVLFVDWLLKLIVTPPDGVFNGIPFSKLLSFFFIVFNKNLIIYQKIEEIKEWYNLQKVRKL